MVKLKLELKQFLSKAIQYNTNTHTMKWQSVSCTLRIRISSTSRETRTADTR